MGKLISFGSDAHAQNKTYTRIKDAREKIIDIIGRDQFEKISKTNPQIILDNGDIC